MEYLGFLLLPPLLHLKSNNTESFKKWCIPDIRPNSYGPRQHETNKSGPSLCICDIKLQFILHKYTEEQAAKHTKTTGSPFVTAIHIAVYQMHHHNGLTKRSNCPATAKHIGEGLRWTRAPRREAETIPKRVAAQSTYKNLPAHS
jgi:hypothetical protein